MKLAVFEYLIAIEKHKSLNKAAQSLFISQPNLTNVIKSFEEEVGYQVIYRNHQGVSFTEKGKQVLMIAHNIIKEKDNLLAISTNHKKITFKLSIGNGDYAMKPLNTLINNQTYQDELDITVVNLTPTEAIEQTYERQIDLAYFIYPTNREKQILDYANSHNLLITPIKQCNSQITLRKDHPLLDHFNLEELWNYTFIDYVNPLPYGYENYQAYINPNKKIHVDHRSMRTKLVAESNAYAIGIITKEDLANKDIVGIPIPNLTRTIFEIRRLEDKDNVIFNEYRKLIENELI